MSEWSGRRSLLAIRANHGQTFANMVNQLVNEIHTAFGSINVEMPLVCSSTTSLSSYCISSSNIQRCEQWVEPLCRGSTTVIIIIICRVVPRHQIVWVCRFQLLHPQQHILQTELLLTVLEQELISNVVLQNVQHLEIRFPNCCWWDCLPRWRW